MINKTRQHYVTLGFLLTVSLAASAQAGQAEPPTTLTLHVYNRAQVPGRALAQPARDVERIFRQMGVEALWLDSPGPSGKKQVNPPAPRRADSSGLQVRLYLVSREAADVHSRGGANACRRDRREYHSLQFRQHRARQALSLCESR